jgi:hypothetical protein
MHTILSTHVYNVIFLMNIFETAIENSKNTFNCMEQIRQN